MVAGQLEEEALVLLRDERGAWVCINNVLIETDVAEVVTLMEEPIESNCPFRDLVEDAKILFSDCECIIQPIMKQENFCATALAKLGADQPEDMLVVNEPPAELRSYLMADMIGIQRERSLLTMCKKAETRKEIHGIWVCRGSPSIRRLQLPSDMDMRELFS
ncbi:unnamed protein product [Camellia sinensis]